VSICLDPLGGRPGLAGSYGPGALVGRRDTA